MLIRSSIHLATLSMLIMLGAAGCTPEAHRYIRFPNLWNPGPAPYQRADAIRHDPFPLNDVGPAIEGGRPREYQQPVNEVERAQRAAPPVGLRPIPLPALPAAPPPFVTTPPVVVTPPFGAPSPVVTTPYPPPTPYQVQPRSPY